MTDCAKKLSDKVDLEPEVEAHLLVVIEEVLDQSKNLASYASIRLDKLSCLDKEERAFFKQGQSFLRDVPRRHWLVANISTEPTGDLLDVCQQVGGGWGQGPTNLSPLKNVQS